MSVWIKNPLSILATDAGGGIVVEGGKIVELVATGTVPKLLVNETYDASQHVVLPGLINTHHHFYQTLTRACPQAINKELFPWLKSLYPIWAGLNPDNFRLAVRVALAELLLSGCTTASDHHYVFPKSLTDGVDIEVDEVQKMGLRGHLTRGSMNLSIEDGGLPPKSVTQSADIILADSERVINQFHERGPGAMIEIALAPCSPFSVTPELMRDTAALAAKLDVRLHTHLAETNNENDFCQTVHGCRPLEYLDRVGWLTDRTWLAHGIHFTPGEMTQLGKSGVGIAHCPSSNYMLASGHCQIKELEAENVAVGLAVDGSASSDCSNMIQEVRQAFFLQRLHYGASKVTHIDAINWATKGSAKILGRDDIGEIALGKQADFALFKMDELRFSGAGDPLAALVLCGAHRADRVMVAGQWRVIDGEIPGLDIPALMQAHQIEAIKLQAT